MPQSPNARTPHLLFRTADQLLRTTDKMYLPQAPHKASAATNGTASKLGTMIQAPDTEVQTGRIHQGNVRRLVQEFEKISGFHGTDTDSLYDESDTDSLYDESDTDSLGDESDTDSLPETYVSQRRTGCSKTSWEWRSSANDQSELPDNLDETFGSLDDESDTDSLYDESDTDSLAETYVAQSSSESSMDSCDKSGLPENFGNIFSFLDDKSDTALLPGTDNTKDSDTQNVALLRLRPGLKLAEDQKLATDDPGSHASFNTEGWDLATDNASSHASFNDASLSSASSTNTRLTSNAVADNETGHEAPVQQAQLKALISPDKMQVETMYYVRKNELPADIPLLEDLLKCAHLAKGVYDGTFKPSTEEKQRLATGQDIKAIVALQAKSAPSSMQQIKNRGNPEKGKIVDNSSGLTAQIMIDSKDRKINLVFGGTTSGNKSSESLLKRILHAPLHTASQQVSSLLTGFGKKANSMEQAKLLLKAVQTYYKGQPEYQSYEVRTVGHSKGATEAIYSALKAEGTPVKAMAFNPARRFDYNLLRPDYNSLRPVADEKLVESTKNITYITTGKDNSSGPQPRLSSIRLGTEYRLEDNPPAGYGTGDLDRITRALSNGIAQAVLQAEKDASALAEHKVIQEMKEQTGSQNSDISNEEDLNVNQPGVPDEEMRQVELAQQRQIEAAQKRQVEQVPLITENDDEELAEKAFLY